MGRMSDSALAQTETDYSSDNLTADHNPAVAPFIHLRVHTAYSLLEGAIRVPDLGKLCEKYKMPAVGIADTGNLFGALELSEKLSDSGIQSITGCAIAMDCETDEKQQRSHNRFFPRLVFLVQNEIGYRNLLQLTSRAYLETDESETPHVPIDLLADHNDGLICLTGGALGPVGHLAAQGQVPAARALLEKLAACFPNRLYVELQRHGMKVEADSEEVLIDLAYQMDLPLVATNEPYFPSADMYESHDAMICVAEGTYVDEVERRHLSKEHYFKSPGEMVELFKDLPEAIENTLEIAQRCAYRPRTHAPILPTFTDNRDGEADELVRQAEEGLRRRLEKAKFADEQDYWDRLKFELDIIINMQFPGYFLIVADFIKWAKEHDIPVGPGRGSGAGSLVAYALTITDLDPLRFGLLFERFLNPERVSMPDFDIDFCQDRRDEVITYVQKKYGRDQVAQIITFGKLQARAVLRDVGRVLRMPYGQVDRLCKLVPNNPANPMTLPEAISSEPRLREEARNDQQVSKLLEIGQQLEGLYRHASTHAAGVVIGDRPLSQLVPVYRDPKSDMPVTQFNMKWVEPAGLVKFDFLGLKTLTVIKTAINLMERAIDIDAIPLNDPKTFEVFQEGDTVGVFQFESSGMQDMLRKMRPDVFEDLIALVALYRPGPMDNIPKYIDCKHGKEQPDYLHPWLETVLKETMGVIIYQEQVMQIAQILAGYSLGDADLLRRAMGKKIQAEMDKQRARFLDGATEKGVDKDQANYIFDLVNKFAGYGFNKSHAACYALVAYQTAYLKANYPVEFMAACMTLDLGNTDKLGTFKSELRDMEIELLPPDINRSEAAFTVEEGKVRYALGALKNVGSQAMRELVRERTENGPFRDLFDFAARIDTQQINKRAMESLVKAGAFDELNPNRGQVFAAIEVLLAHAQAIAKEKSSNQVSLFGEAQVELATPGLPLIEDWLPSEKLAQEFSAVGFYISGHPLDDYMPALKRKKVITCAEMWELADSMRDGQTRTITMAGSVISRKDKKSQRGNPFSFVQFGDPTGTYEAVFFSDLFEANRDILVNGEMFVVGVELEIREGQPSLKGNSLQPVDQVAAKSETGIRIFVNDDKPLTSLKNRLPGPGKSPIILTLMIRPQEGSNILHEVDIDLGSYRVTPQDKAALKAVHGVLEVEEV